MFQWVALLFHGLVQDRWPLAMAFSSDPVPHHRRHGIGMERCDLILFPHDSWLAASDRFVSKFTSPASKYDLPLRRNRA